jgi:hypothetical protein
LNAAVGRARIGLPCADTPTTDTVLPAVPLWLLLRPSHTVPVSSRPFTVTLLPFSVMRIGVPLPIEPGLPETGKAFPGSTCTAPDPPELVPGGPPAMNCPMTACVRPSVTQGLQSCTCWPPTVTMLVPLLGELTTVPPAMFARFAWPLAETT